MVALEVKAVAAALLPHDDSRHGRRPRSEAHLHFVRQLDAIYRDLNKSLKALAEDSLLETRSKEDEIVQLKVDLVKHIVAVKLEEQKVREAEAEKATRKERLLEIIADKQDEAYRDMDIDELKNLVGEM